MYLSDTNVCIHILNNNKPIITQRLATHNNPNEIYLCTVVQLELYYGACKSARRIQNLAKLEKFFSQFNSLTLDKNVASIAGQIRSGLEISGTLIGPDDLQIAAIALTNQLTLVTHNTREFGHVQGLILEDWEL